MARQTTESMAVFLRDITIEGFRGIGRLEISFLGPDDKPVKMAVLAGPNGCGKTSILEACLIACDREDLVRGPTDRKAIRSGSDGWKIAATFQSPGANVHPMGVWRACYAHKQAGLQGTLLEPAKCLYFSSLRAPLFARSPALSRSQSASGGHARSRSGKSATGESERHQAIREHLKNAKLYELMIQESPERKDPLRNGKPYTKFIEKLDTVWRLFHPGSPWHFAVEPIGEKPEEDFDVYLIGPAKERVPLEALSSGQLEIFGFAGWLLASEFDRGIIFVDEPELHLDAQWHRLVLKALRILQPESQIVVATHSPEVYDSVRSYERHLLIPQDDPRVQAWGLAPAQGVAK